MPWRFRDSLFPAGPAAIICILRSVAKRSALHLLSVHVSCTFCLVPADLSSCNSSDVVCNFDIAGTLVCQVFLRWATSTVGQHLLQLYWDERALHTCHICEPVSCNQHREMSCLQEAADDGSLLRTG